MQSFYNISETFEYLFVRKNISEVKIVMLRWNILQYLKQNVATIFRLPLKIGNISYVFLQYFVLFE